MCGLVFAGGKHSLSSTDMKLFQALLMCDTFRGTDSTGVFSLFRPYNKPPFFRVSKQAMEGWDFARSEFFENCVTNKTPSTIANAAPITEYAKVVFGHNRAATVGAVNAKNAHPFTHGHITLAHNGTIRNQKLLPEHQRFQVDSENIAYAISVEGIDEVVKKLNGAYCLIWFDANNNTLNILRNDERPFHLLETGAGDWYGASEEQMLMWLATRGKSGRTVKRHFECEVGVQYVFDVSKGCELKEERKHELPRFQSAYYETDYWYGGNRHYSYSSGSSVSTGQGQNTSQQTRQTTTPSRTTKSPTELMKELSKMLDKETKIGDRLTFELFEFKPYPGNPNMGQVIGYLPELDEYIEISSHSVQKSKYTGDGDTFTGEIVSIYEYNYVVNLVVKNIEPYSATILALPSPEEVPVIDLQLEEEEDDVPPFFRDTIDEDDTIVEIERTATGEMFSRRGWNRSIHNSCANCGDPIPFDDIGRTNIINGYAFCGTCMDSHLTVDGEEPQEDPKPEGWCEHCGEIHNQFVLTGHMSPEYWENMKDGCPTKEQFRAKFEKMLDAKYLTNLTGNEIRSVNGMLMNKAQWEKMNKCRCCNAPIPFHHIGVIDFWGEAPLCVKCTDDVRRLENGE